MATKFTIQSSYKIDDLMEWLRVWSENDITLISMQLTSVLVGPGLVRHTILIAYKDSNG